LHPLEKRRLFTAHANTGRSPQADVLPRDVYGIGMLMAMEERTKPEVDPPLCPECGAPMRVIALIEDPAVIERILSWLGLWDPPQACGPSPPGERASLPLTYYPVPDIA
jgi:hypothetical protein